MRVALDTSVLIPLLQTGELNAHDRLVRERMLAVLDEPRVEVVIPAPALAELAANPRLSDEQQSGLALTVASKFEVAGLDARTVVVAAPLLARLPAKTGENKQCLKVDALIVACAIGAHCDVIYATDPHIASIADSSIAVREPSAVVREQDFGFTSG